MNYRRKPVTAEQYQSHTWPPNGVELMWISPGGYTVYGRNEPLALPDHQKTQAPCVRTIAGDKLINPGDWIVTDEDGRHIYTDREFRRLFEPVPEQVTG